MLLIWFSAPAANIFSPNCECLPEMKLCKSLNFGQLFKVLIVNNPLVKFNKFWFVPINYPGDSMETECTVIIGMDFRMRNNSVTAREIFTITMKYASLL